VVVYPDMNLYQEIIFLQKWFKKLWIVENVQPYYEPLIQPNIMTTTLLETSINAGVKDLLAKLQHDHPYILPKMSISLSTNQTSPMMSQISTWHIRCGV
jgi:hypothetical protein